MIFSSPLIGLDGACLKFFEKGHSFSREFVRPDTKAFGTSGVFRSRMAHIFHVEPRVGSGVDGRASRTENQQVTAGVFLRACGFLKDDKKLCEAAHTIRYGIFRNLAQYPSTPSKRRSYRPANGNVSATGNAGGVGLGATLI